MIKPEHKLWKLYIANYSFGVILILLTLLSIGLMVICNFNSVSRTIAMFIYLWCGWNFLYSKWKLYKFKSRHPNIEMKMPKEIEELEDDDD